MKQKKEFSLDLRGLRSKVAARVTEIVRGNEGDMDFVLYPSTVSRVLSGKRGSRYADLIRETARRVAIEMGGAK